MQRLTNTSHCIATIYWTLSCPKYKYIYYDYYLNFSLFQSDQWNGSSEEIFDSIKFDFDDPNFLPLFEGLTNERTPESNCSDSGMSSDHQMSPHVIQDEDEDSTVATIAPFQQDEMQIIYTDQDIQSNEEIELDSTDVSFIETNTLDEETFEETEMDDSIVEGKNEKKKKNNRLILVK